MNTDFSKAGLDIETNLAQIITQFFNAQFLKTNFNHKRGCVGCPENAKSLKSQAPQGFSGCLDIDNDEMNKKKFLSASPRVN